MVEWHYKSKRKPSGGMLKTLSRSDKKLSSRGGVFSSTTIAGDEKAVEVQSVRKTGGNTAQKAKKVLFANISEGKKTFKARILRVVENSANRLYTRRNILTKGAFIAVEADGGEKTAKITSRPGQSGVVNAVFAIAPVAPKKQKKEQAKDKNTEKTENTVFVDKKPAEN